MIAWPFERASGIEPWTRGWNSAFEAPKLRSGSSCFPPFPAETIDRKGADGRRPGDLDPWCVDSQDRRFGSSHGHELDHKVAGVQALQGNRRTRVVFPGSPVGGARGWSALMALFS